MKKFVATIAATGLLMGGVATAASAETIHRNGAKKVTITADLNKKVPAGATVTKSRITVKKGKKTVAKNKKRYRAKKGKYKVISTVWLSLPTTTKTWVPGTDTYVPGTTTTGPATTKNITADDLWINTCTVASRTIAQDNSTYTYWDGQPDYLTGEVWVDYTANCSAEYYDDDYDVQRTNVDVKWQESTYLFNLNVTGDKSIDLYSDNDFYYVGQYVGGVYDFTLLTPVTHTTPGKTTTTPGYYESTPGYYVTTANGTTSHKVKSKRTVRVR